MNDTLHIKLVLLVGQTNNLDTGGTEHTGKPLVSITNVNILNN